MQTFGGRHSLLGARVDAGGVLEPRLRRQVALGDVVVEVVQAGPVGGERPQTGAGQGGAPQPPVGQGQGAPSNTGGA